MKTVIITGANGNLGSAVTAEFLGKGYRVIATVRREEDRTEFPANENLQVEVIDLNDETKATGFITRTIGEHSTIDAALLLVGGFAMGDIAKTSMNDIRQQIALNFETAYHIVQPLFDHMMQSGSGRLVFIGARPAIEPSYGKKLLAYGLSKSLLFTLAGYLNATAKGKNVTATVVAPSTLDTPINRKNMPDADPGTWVKPAVLAEILEFIVSDRSHPLRETVLKVYNNS
jgi:NAD(P)-dependent dehydrogenase (short-subunit alcohol dehydrogenase family)